MGATSPGVGDEQSQKAWWDTDSCTMVPQGSKCLEHGSVHAEGFAEVYTWPEFCAKYRTNERFRTLADGAGAELAKPGGSLAQ